MAFVVDEFNRGGLSAGSPKGRRFHPAATNRHSHISTRRWCISGLAVKQDAYDRSRVFSRANHSDERELSPYFGPLTNLVEPAATKGVPFEMRTRARNARPTSETQALAQIPPPKVVTLATAAMTGAPTATPETRTA